MELTDKEARIQRLRHVAEDLNKLVETQKQQIDENIKHKADFILNTLLPIVKKDKLTRKDIAKAMEITCYGNIGYCCSLEGKDCPFRKVAMIALRISDEEFKSKEGWVFSLMEHKGR